MNSAIDSTGTLERSIFKAIWFLSSALPLVKPLVKPLASPLAIPSAMPLDIPLA